MRTLASWTLGLAGALLFCRAAKAEGPSRTLAVEEAVDIALQSNPRLLARQANVRGGRDLERSATARMLPSVHVFNEYQHWDSPFAIPFGGQSFSVRNQDTNTFTASADQPLLGLFHLSHEASAEARSADATEAEYATARAEVKQAVEVGYLRLFEAKALEEIARASESELADQIQVTKAKLDAGVLTNADLLRVQVAVANAKQQEILAHTQGEIARATLLGALGLPLDGPAVEFAEPRKLLAHAGAALPPLKEAQGQALAARPEMKQLHLRADAADETHSARLLSMLPEVDAEAAYNRLDGQIFAPKNAAFVGVKVQWPIWEWGASWYAQRAAREQASAAQQDIESERRDIGVEVASDLAQSRAAASAVDVARETIASAVEAYRVTEALLKAGSATTTDLLDAQAALTQARLNLTRAEYEQAVAQVTFARSVGK